MESVGRGNCVPLFETEEIEIHHIPRLADATLRELGVNTIGALMRLRDGADVSHVTCHMSGVTCHVSHVMHNFFLFFFFFSFFFIKTWI